MRKGMKSGNKHAIGVLDNQKIKEDKIKITLNSHNVRGYVQVT